MDAYFTRQPQPRGAARACLLALLASACLPADPFDGSFEVLSPVTTRDGLVWTDRAHDELVFVLPTADALAVRRAVVGDERTRSAGPRRPAIASPCSP